MRIYSIIFFTFSFSVMLFGQDAHYWTNQYGTRGQLLSGNVVGSIEDLSSTYYNPGVVAFTKDMKLLLSGGAFELIHMNIPNGAGEGLNLRTTTIRPSPNIFALKFDFSGTEKHSGAISFLVKKDFNWSIRGINVENMFSNNSQSTTRSGALLNDLRLIEGWIGFTWSHQLNNNLGFGITQYVAIRSHRGRFQTMSQVADTSGQSALNLLRDYRYYNVRLLWKVGLIYNLEKLGLGLTVTTPSVNLFGRGRLFYNYSITDNSGIVQSELAALFEDKMNTKYLSPLSIAAGASYSINSSRIYITAEWFNQLNQFNIYDTKASSFQFAGTEIPFQLFHGSNSVINFGIGFQHRFNPELGIYFGFNTDFAGVKDDSISNIVIATWDIYHFTLGTSFTMYNIDFNIGLGYSLSTKVATEILNIRGSNNKDRFGNEPSTEAKYQRIKLILGLSF